jgi:WhiB family redox-sensing transcriptional regulator
VNGGWWEHAACAWTYPDEWFPAKGKSSRVAKRICQRCPVRTECLEYALATGTTEGIWGGMSGRQRQRLAENRRAGQVAA